MDFIPQAGLQYFGCLCECCSNEIAIGSAIYVDEDADQQGDGFVYRRRVQCGSCHDFVREREAIATLRVWDDVCKLVWSLRGYSGSYILETLNARKDEAKQGKVAA